MSEAVVPFVQYPVHVLEALEQTPLPGQHRRVFDSVVRLTIGWHRQSDRISAGQISKRTGIPRQHVADMLADLERWGLLIVERAGHRRKSTLAVQHVVERWQVGETTHATRVRRGASAPAERGRSSAPPERDSLPRQSVTDLPRQSGHSKERKKTSERKPEFAVALPDRTRERRVARSVAGPWGHQPRPSPQDQERARAELAAYRETLDRSKRAESRRRRDEGTPITAEALAVLEQAKAARAASELSDAAKAGLEGFFGSAALQKASAG